MKKSALTSLELLLSIAIISLILASSVPFYFSFYTKSKTESVTKEIIAAIRRAKIKAQGMELDDNWGVAIGYDNKITVFKGNNYSTRDNAYDEENTIDSGIDLLANQEIIFEKNTALPNNSPTIQFTDADGKITQIIIDSYGNITTQ